MKSKQTVIYWPGMLVVIWLGAVVGGYFVSHKPVTVVFASRLFGAGWQVLVGVSLVMVAGGLGWRVLLPLKIRPLVRMALSAAGGVGLVSLGYLVIGATLGTSPLVAWGFLGAAFFLGRQHILPWWRSWRDLSRLWRSGDWLARGLAGGIGLILLFTLANSLSPPVKFDSLVYHLALPRAYLQAGRITYLPWNAYWGMPQLLEILFALGMALGGPVSATFLAWFLGLIAICGMGDFYIQKLGARAGWVGLGALLSGFTIASSLAWGYAGWMTMLFGLGFFICMVEWKETDNRAPLLWAGVFAGLALGTKYTAGVLMVSGGIVIGVDNFRTRHGWKKVFQNLALFAGSGILVTLPWWIKNILGTGNPFYPFFAVSGAMNGLRLSLFQDLPAYGSWLDFFFLPIRATLTGLEGAPGYSASLGPLLLGLGVFSGIHWRSRDEGQRRSLVTALVILTSGLGTWMVAGRLSGLLIQSRLYLSIFPVAALLAGAGFWGFEKIHWPGVRLERVAGVIVLLVLGLNTVHVGLATLQAGSLQYLSGLRSSQDFLSDNLGMYALAMEAVRDLPEGSQTLLLWEPRSFYCQPVCFSDELLDRWLVARQGAASPDEILGNWRKAGYTHLLVNHSGAAFFRSDSRYTPDDWAALDDLLRPLPVQTDLNGVYTLYRLTP